MQEANCTQLQSVGGCLWMYLTKVIIFSSDNSSQVWEQINRSWRAIQQLSMNNTESVSQSLILSFPAMQTLECITIQSEQTHPISYSTLVENADRNTHGPKKGMVVRGWAFMMTYIFTQCPVQNPIHNKATKNSLGQPIWKQSACPWLLCLVLCIGLIGSIINPCRLFWEEV